MNRQELRPPLTTLWSGRDPFAAAATLAREAASGDLVRDVEGRRTLRFEIDSRGYYLKLQNGVSWGRIAEELIHLRRPVLGAGNEWDAIRRCHELGVPTMTAVGFGERGSGPARRDSFIVTEAIEPAVDLDEFTRNWREQAPPPALKHALIRAVASIARRMHEGGVNHRDFYLCHFLMRTVPEPSAGALQLALIDLHRAQLRSHTPRRWRDKDLAGLYFSALDIGLTRRDKLRFLRVYFPTSLRETLQSERTLLTQLEREAARLKLRFERKFANRPALQR
ncbi:MAG: lipopolysaccharide core heptose(I) kinase RfaP [Betaproteobacteria bacterium HGW-Betaproteobacteria-13]|jgi:heptose I phosphotransferase|nr:MAG: lipopolysaccharide core heptose(I) kinase RfaP [Betaproteobacteria bacterium HGW-Betaproteobacteria-19]PKO81504.1 MAG: lipopolysaccharide core heptose(I) kinase RfaP [Betaproteobacteria bacterium HGW-Betaproteobacteria-13]